MWVKAAATVLFEVVKIGVGRLVTWWKTTMLKRRNEYLEDLSAQQQARLNKVHDSLEAENKINDAVNAAVQEQKADPASQLDDMIGHSVSYGEEDA